MEQNGNPLWGYWRATKRRLRAILAIAAAAATISAAVSLSLPKIYSASAALYALETQSPLASTLGQLPLAQLGLAVPSRAAEYLVAILESETVMERVATSQRLGEDPRFVGKTDLTRHELLEALRDTTRVRTAGSKVTVTVDTRSPRLSADLANEYLRQLERSIYRFSRRKRGFLEAQLAEHKAALKGAQEALKAFQVRHQAVAQDAQATEAVKALAALESERLENEIALEQNATALKTAGGIDELVRLSEDKELLERKAQDLDGALAQQRTRLARMPAVLTQLGRLTWEVASRQAVVDLLQQSYENARIREREEEARYQVLDYAVPPEKPARPKILINTFIAGVLGTCVGVAWALVTFPLRLQAD